MNLKSYYFLIMLWCLVHHVINPVALCPWFGDINVLCLLFLYYQTTSPLMFIYALCIFPKLDLRSGDGVLQGPIISPPTISSLFCRKHFKKRKCCKTHKVSHVCVLKYVCKYYFIYQKHFLIFGLFINMTPNHLAGENLTPSSGDKLSNTS